MLRISPVFRGALPGFFLLLAQAAWSQVASETVPSRRFTWSQLLEQETKAALEADKPTPDAAPDHGRAPTRTVPDLPILPSDVAERQRTSPVLPLAACEGFRTWPNHSGAFGFLGLGDNGGSFPPDTMGAVGPRHVVTMVNTQVQIHNRSGSLTYSTVSLGTFWAGLTKPFDPKIYYDNLSGRWIAVCLGNSESANSDWEIIISSTNDPTGSWTSYHFDGDAADTRWVDFPGVGFNDKWVAVTFNAFAVPGAPGTPVEGPKMWVLNKPQLLAGGVLGFVEYEVDFDVASGFTLQPAVCMEANVSDLYILDSGYVGDPNGNTNYVRMSRITGTAEAPEWSVMPGSSNPTPGLFPVQNRFSSTIPLASQQGSPTALYSGDTRMANVVYRNGHIWAVHEGGYPADAPDRAAVYWYELAPSLPNPIVQSGVIETGGPDAHYTYPSIAVNCGNDACVGFTAVSPAIFASAAYATRLAGDPPGVTGPTQYFKSGRAAYVRIDSRSGRNRWGDYSATVVDPLDDKTFWTLQEYAETPFTGGIGRWGVQWAQITEDCQAPGITQQPQSQDICLGQPVTFSVGATGSVAQYQWNEAGQPIIGATFYDYTIPAVSADDADQYSCTVIGLCSAVSSDSATLDVLTAPIVTGFVAWPNATCPGDVASIIPAVPDSGAFPMTVTLQKYNGSWQDVPGRTISYGDTFVFSPLLHEDTGDYRLKYTNVCGNGYTSQRRIQVGVSFDEAPAAASEPPCGEATFGVVARGLGTLAYRWLHGGVPLADDDRISGAGTPALSIDRLLYEDEGSYVCEVTDNCEMRPSNPASLTLPTPTWKLIAASGAPVHRGSIGFAYDASRKVSVLYGGYSSSQAINGYSNETWEYDGATWTQKDPLHKPGKRSNHKMCYDSDRKRVYLWGGYGGELPPFSGQLADLWAYDGNDWTLLNETLTAHDSPYPTTTPELTYDSGRRKVVLVRNRANTTQNSETWEYDPDTNEWALAFADNGFPAGYGGAIAYDPIRQQVVHYLADGGFSADRQTWRFNGLSWARDPVTTPRAPFTQMAFDATRKRSVIFSANFGSLSLYTTSFSDLGRDWAELLPNDVPSSPPAYRLFTEGMAFDTNRRAMVALFQDYYGGENHEMLAYEFRYLDRIVFDRHPMSQLLVPGGDATFAVDAAGYGLLTHQWLRNGQVVADGASPGGGTYVGTTTATLTIQGASEPDGGIYSCAVSNACGSVTSASALLSTSPADFNADGVVDLVDHAFVESCTRGPDGVALEDDCEIADLNGDGRVDLLDFAFFQVLFGGAG